MAEYVPTAIMEKVLDSAHELTTIDHDDGLAIVKAYPELTELVIPLITNMKALAEIYRVSGRHEKLIAKQIREREVTFEVIHDAMVFLKDPEITAAIYANIKTSKEAYLWRLLVDNTADVRDLITDSKEAYFWALSIGDRDVMIDRVTESEWAYQWACNIGNLNVMRGRITDIRNIIGIIEMQVTDVRDELIAYYRDTIKDPLTAYEFAKQFGRDDRLRSLITTSESATKWALEWFEDRAGLYTLVDNEKDALAWVSKFPEYASTMIHLIQSSEGALQFSKMYPHLRKEVLSKVSLEKTLYKWYLQWPEDIEVIKDRITSPSFGLMIAMHDPRIRQYVRKTVRGAFWLNAWLTKWPEDHIYFGNLKKDHNSQLDYL